MSTGVPGHGAAIHCSVLCRPVRVSASVLGVSIQVPLVGGFVEPPV